MHAIVSTPAQQTSILRQIHQRQALQRSKRAKREGFCSPPSNPDRIKTTIYQTPTSREILEKLKKQLGYSTNSLALDSLLLWVGRELRLIPGVGPRGLRDFTLFVGLEDTLPPEYRFTASEREYQRAQRARNVGLSHKSPEQIRLEIEEYEQETAAFMRDELAAALVDIEPLEAPEVAEVEPLEAPEVAEVRYFLKAPSRKEASLCSEKISELVIFAALYNPAALDRVLDRMKGRTLEALEDELTALVEMERPETPVPGKMRIKRNMS